ncbi:ephrin type-B receptor 1-B-like [Amphibalanus amphitrite]|uniref:ephrin type-B receptor 1-B-like n=1 Tax=Amphibalanus amphitrite TaxID=1232801 RepID=UPI001C90614E|nr:ephrin type-B receptor 1-B-like [Amphibalanus amphitrite]
MRPPPSAGHRWALLALLLLCGPPLTHAEEVVLLDTTKEQLLEWTRYPFGPQSKTPGWSEESYTNFEKGINWRSHVVCDVAFTDVNNWLWTPFIERGEAERIYIELKFSMRDCSLFPGKALSCKETFSLLYYEFDAATREPPPWEPESYKLIDRIAADRGRSSTSDQQVINVETRSIPVTKKGVYFAVRDQGACISLLAVRVFYRTCAEVRAGFATFASAPTGRQETTIKTARGTCVTNAEPGERGLPQYICKGNGEWDVLDGHCNCRPGYEAIEANQTCHVCPPATYKSVSGVGACLACPDHSRAERSGSDLCACEPGYWRAETDPPGSACTRPPSAPQQLRAEFVDQNSAVLVWSAPELNGGRPGDTSYSVKCRQCGADVTFSPAQTGLNSTRVTVSGLSAATTYQISVSAQNGVSAVSPAEDEHADLEVTTHASGAVPSMVSEVRVTLLRPSEALLSWRPPSDPEDAVLKYEARYFTKSEGANSSSVFSDSASATVTGLRLNTEYGFQVRARTARGWSEYSRPLYTTTGPAADSAYLGGSGANGGGMNVEVIAGVSVAVGVLLAVVIVVAVLFVKSRSMENPHKKRPRDVGSMGYHNGLAMQMGLNTPVQTPSTALTSPAFSPVTHQRTYIDPHTYEDPNQAIREFAREIDASHIIIEAVIGGGEFGDVCRGKLMDVTVAIKTLKPGTSEKAKVDFLTEASIMGQFQHPNVIFLQGVVTKSNPVMIITEFMENGSLDTFLKANDGQFQILQLVAMLRCVASGMQYLSEMNYVHRDLAARNVLVNAQLVCKIADFGLSREIEASKEGAYTTRGGKIPVRWTAPEAIAFRKFTSTSDVWSFGIVAWEVMSYGERPYWNWSNQDVIKSIEKGYRLPAPMDCPEALHQLMLDCWQKERAHRPPFASIVRTLDSLINCPETLRKVAPNRSAGSLWPPAADPATLTSLEAWLASIKMSRYLENLQRAGVTSLDAAARLTEPDLVAVGVTLVGHQKKMAQAIASLRLQVRTHRADACFV